MAPSSDLLETLPQRIQANQPTLALLFGRVFSDMANVAFEEPSPWKSSLPEDIAGPGLVFIFRSQTSAGLALYPEAAGPISAEPKPDNEREEELRQFASELGGMVLGQAVSPDDCTVARVQDLRATVERCVRSPSSVLVPIRIETNNKASQWYIGLPVDNPEQMLAKTSNQNQAASSAGAASASAPTKALAKLPLQYGDLDEGLRLLPAYARSLLKIRVPVTVTLASAKQSLDTILNIGSGSIIHFNKSCEDTLTLEVSGHPVAVGETVKVGDKFGLWITSMIMPDERFWVIGRRQPRVRAR